eukprot:2702479-Amphidinium_carterae.1
MHASTSGLRNELQLRLSAAMKACVVSAFCFCMDCRWLETGRGGLARFHNPVYVACGVGCAGTLGMSCLVLHSFAFHTACCDLNVSMMVLSLAKPPTP